jgi:LPXTG-motif cell wall-anchored protein
MKASTKKKLDALTQQVNYLGAETGSKDKTIKYLAVGIVGVMVVIFFVVFFRKRRR